MGCNIQKRLSWEKQLISILKIKYETTFAPPIWNPNEIPYTSRPCKMSSFFVQMSRVSLYKELFERFKLSSIPNSKDFGSTIQPRLLKKPATHYGVAMPKGQRGGPKPTTTVTRILPWGQRGITTLFWREAVNKTMRHGQVNLIHNYTKIQVKSSHRAISSSNNSFYKNC